MKKKKIVIALGHDALGTTLPEQHEATKHTAKAVADFIRDDYEVVITHSNGPQVGMIHTAMSEFCRIYPEYTATPTAVCSAMSQGYIGYDLQNAIRTELLGRGIYKTVSTILTQVVVDPYDEAFYHPTKIIGRVMTEAEAEEEEKKGNHVTQVEGGYRRVVAAPKPVDIVEKDAIKALVDADQVVIACGGGGIPVLAQDNKLQGASAVIEKDLAAGKLADTLDADRLVILTSVDKVCLNYGKEDEKPLDTMTVDEAKKYLAAGEFDEGTMAPKIEAAIIMLVLIRNKNNVVYVDHHNFKPEFGMIRRILYIAIPSGMENGIFQFGRIIVVSIISTFGTVQIAANAVANSIDGMGTLCGQAISLAMITVVGQCVGAGDLKQVRLYTKKLLKIAYILTICVNSTILLTLPWILKIFSLSDETRSLAFILICIHNGCAILLWPLSFVLPNALRACNDVKYTMVVSIFSMCMFRIVFSYIIGQYFGMGAIGVWIAMVIDWIFRVIFFVYRFVSGKWEKLTYANR